MLRLQVMLVWIDVYTMLEKHLIEQLKAAEVSHALNYLKHSITLKRPTDPFSRQEVRPLTHTCSLTPAHTSPRSHTHSLAYSLTHSLTHSLNALLAKQQKNKAKEAQSEKDRELMAMAEKAAGSSHGRNLWMKSKDKLFGLRLRRQILAEFHTDKHMDASSYSVANLAPPLHTTLKAGGRMQWAEEARREGEEKRKREVEGAKQLVIDQKWRAKQKYGAFALGDGEMEEDGIGGDGSKDGANDDGSSSRGNSPAGPPLGRASSVASMVDGAKGAPHEFGSRAPSPGNGSLHSPHPKGAPVVFKHRRLSAAEQQVEDVALVTDWILGELVQKRMLALSSTAGVREREAAASYINIPMEERKEALAVIDTWSQQEWADRTEVRGSSVRIPISHALVHPCTHALMHSCTHTLIHQALRKASQKMKTFRRGSRSIHMGEMALAKNKLRAAHSKPELNRGSSIIHHAHTVKGMSLGLGRSGSGIGGGGLLGRGGLDRHNLMAQSAPALIPKGSNGGNGNQSSLRNSWGMAAESSTTSSGGLSESSGFGSSVELVEESDESEKEEDGNDSSSSEDDDQHESVPGAFSAFSERDAAFSRKEKRRESVQKCVGRRVVSLVALKDKALAASKIAHKKEAMTSRQAGWKATEAIGGSNNPHDDQKYMRKPTSDEIQRATRYYPQQHQPTALGSTVHAGQWLSSMPLAPFDSVEVAGRGAIVNQPPTIVDSASAHVLSLDDQSTAAKTPLHQGLHGAVQQRNPKLDYKGKVKQSSHDENVLLATSSSAPSLLDNGYYHTADAFGGTGKHMTSWLRPSLNARHDPSPIGGRCAHKLDLAFYGLGSEAAKKIAAALGYDDADADGDKSTKLTGTDKPAKRKATAFFETPGEDSDEDEMDRLAAQTNQLVVPAREQKLMLSNGAKTMVLAGNGIGGEACSVIVRAISQRARQLTSIDLRENTIGVEGALALADCLSEPTCWLKSLDLSANKLGNASQRQRQQYKVPALAVPAAPTAAEVFGAMAAKGGKKKKKKGKKGKEAPAPAKAKAPPAKAKKAKKQEAAATVSVEAPKPKKHAKIVAGPMVAQSVRHRMAIRTDTNDQETNDMVEDELPVSSSEYFEGIEESTLFRNSLKSGFTRKPVFADSAQEAEMQLRRSRREVSRLPQSHCGDTPAQIILRAMCTNKSLQVLKLNHNGINRAEELAAMLQQNNHLEHLECAWNEIRGAGAIKVAKALASNMGLRNVDFHFNAFGDGAALAFAAELPKFSAPRQKAKPGGKAPAANTKLSSKLRSVNLGGNRITDASCAALADMLTGASTMHALLLDGNPISKHGAAQLRQAAVEANGVVSLEGCSILSHAERVGMNEEIERPRRVSSGESGIDTFS
jgi:hypothetical protein